MTFGRAKVFSMRTYIVVFAEPADYLEGSKNLKYRGVDRLPPYPSDVIEEKEAIDEYVFGDYKAADGTIPTLEKAKQLIRLFSRSPRPFEIIYYETVEEAQESESDAGMSVLGYDVASPGGDRWSIVSDFPPAPEMQHFVAELNEFGLFGTQWVAQRFLEEYKRLQLPDYDMDLRVLRVYEVESSNSRTSPMQGA